MGPLPYKPRETQSPALLEVATRNSEDGLRAESQRSPRTCQIPVIVIVIAIATRNNRDTIKNDNNNSDNYDNIGKSNGSTDNGSMAFATRVRA